jgi:hypothetical protein
LSLSTTTAVRAAGLAGAAPAVITELAVTDDLADFRFDRSGWAWGELQLDGVRLRPRIRRRLTTGQGPPRPQRLAFRFRL